MVIRGSSARSQMRSADAKFRAATFRILLREAAIVNAGRSPVKIETFVRRSRVMLPICIESLRTNRAEADESFTLTIDLTCAASDAPPGEPPAPSRHVEIVVSWRSRHFRLPETLGEGWMAFAIPEHGLEGARRRIEPGATEVTLAGLRPTEAAKKKARGKKRRLRAHVLVDGVPVAAAKTKRKTRAD